MENIKKQCPEFPHFGASYPDATCIDGYLWDLDSYDGEGYYARGGDDPCPFCNTEEYTQNLIDSEYSEKFIKDHLDYLNQKYNS